MKRKTRVAELQRHIERAFLGLSIAVLILVLLGILIAARRAI
jgi:ABC-type proline/glycine betaine transport system permease subunit